MQKPALRSVKGKALLSKLSGNITAWTSGTRGRVLTFLFFLVSIFVVGAVLRANWSELRTFQWVFRPSYIALTIFMVLLTFSLTAITWHIIFTRFLPDLSLRQNAKIWAYSNFARRIPGTVWYIASRAALYEQHGVRKSIVAYISIFEIVVILISGTILSLVTLPFWTESYWTPTNMMWSGLFLVFGCLLLNPKFVNAIARKLNQDGEVRLLKLVDIGLSVGSYLIVWVCGGVAFWGIVNVVQNVEFEHFGRLLNVWAVANTLSFAGALTFSAIGVRDISLTVMLSLIVPPPVALIITILTRLLWLISEFLAGLVSLIL